MDYTVAFLFVVVPLFLFPILKRYFSTSDDVSSLQGPKSSSWIYGNMTEFKLGIPAGDTEMGWFKKYGDVFKFHACFGEERLMVSDPEAIRHIFHETGIFIKSRTYQLINIIGFGEGSVISAHGEDHRRIRGVMNTMFSAARVRELTPTLDKLAKELAEDLAMKSGSTVDVYRLLHRTTLRAITEAVIGYDTTFDKEYTSTYEDLLLTVSQRSKRGIIANAILSLLPVSSIQFLMNYPPPDLKKLLDHRKMAHKISEKVIASRLASLKCDGPPENDLFSVLVRSNEKIANNMSNDELKDQFGGIMTAGEDTTANSMVWILYVLAQHPEWQAKLRQEIKDADQGVNGTQIDYDRLPFLNAVIKEVLRVYPAGSLTEREVACDTIIPLSKTVSKLSGQSVNMLRVNKGRILRWDDWTLCQFAKFYRWTTHMSWVRWRFAILELQVLTSEIVHKFSFSLPPGLSIRSANGITVVPLDGEGKTRLPLVIELVCE